MGLIMNKGILYNITIASSDWINHIDNHFSVEYILIRIHAIQQNHSLIIITYI